MDEIIKRATNSIDEILESIPQWDIFTLTTKTRLIETRHLLQRFVEPDSARSDRTRLFGRQLKRLMDYNDSLSDIFWIKLRDDIVYALEISDDQQSVDGPWKRFLRRMNLEEKLEQREFQLKQISGNGRVQLQSLIENIDNFLSRTYGIPEVSFTCENAQQLQAKLNSIQIPLSWSQRSFNSLGSQCFANDRSSQRMNNDSSNFLPSQRIDMTSSDESEVIEDILGCHRWIVILGDPGSAKTTLLQWLACIFAKAARRGHEHVDWKGSNRLPVRIPILIRIGEFEVWLNQHRTKTLMDYIGEHTWFSERYCDDKSGLVLKELIHHGHTLILLDGMDEISDVRRRGEIVDLVEKFVEEYTRAPDFISAFDDKIFDVGMQLAYGDVVQTQPPNTSGGNQIVITSRIVGYQFRPLDGPYMQHYTLALMDHQEANEFVKKWLRLVDKSIRDILLQEGIELGQKAVKTSLKKVFSVAEAIFANCSELLKSNPSLLSLICTLIYQFSAEVHLKSRVEVYSHTVEKALLTWKNQDPSVSDRVLNNFLIGLATYLHLRSSSGLIDAFDMENLCCLTLRQQKISNNRATLRAYSKKIIVLLESNTAIVTEKGLEVFGFLHLSFQEYFVAQMLVGGSAADQVAQRMLSSALNPRFRESLLLAFGWISWKWPFHEYDKFCTILVTRTDNHTIPFGTFLVFAAIDDMYRLPSTSIVFTALNNLMHHPSDAIRDTYLISSLSKLPENIIIEWMESYLKGDRCLLKFCRSFPVRDGRYNDASLTVRKRIPAVIYQQLWSFHHRKSSTEFWIDQILRRTLVGTHPTFNKDLSLHFESHEIPASSIHPLILSVMVAVCGGMYFTISKNDIFNINFSPKQMHRASLIIEPILKYLRNEKEPYLIKVQTLIAHYESKLEKSSPSDTSVDIIDTFIALICLQGLSQPFIYQKYDGYQALPLALVRFKQTWFYLKELCNLDQRGGSSVDVSSLVSRIDAILKAFSSQHEESVEQCMSFSVACASAWKRLGLWNLANKHSIAGYSSSYRAGRYFHCQPDFMHYVGEKELVEMGKSIHLLRVLRIFLPQSLQPLYCCATVDNGDSLPLIVLLSECLRRLEVVDEYDLNFDLAIPMLQPILREHMLENYAILLIRNRYADLRVQSSDREKFWKAMDEHKLLDSLKDQPKDVQSLISIECQRIADAKTALQTQEKIDVQLFAAAISLARLLQAQYRSHKHPTISLSLAESEEVYFAVNGISNIVLRIIISSFLLEMKDPMIFHEEKRDGLRSETVDLLESLLPSLHLLTSVVLFVRCHSLRGLCPASFQRMASIIGEKFSIEPVTNAQHRAKEAAYIALRQLNNTDLATYLSDFIRRNKGVSDLLHFNSTAFYQYFTHTTSLDSLNPTLLSAMYLVELAFDAQILNTHCKSSISPWKELKQLWTESSKTEKIMTLRVARWITNNLQIWSKDEIQPLVADICRCALIERAVLSEIQTWLSYRMDEKLRVFAHYAALQLIINGSDAPVLMDIVEEMFVIDNKFQLASIVECLLTSSVANLSILRQILIILQENVCLASRVCGWVSRKETLEVILNLEVDRIKSSVDGTLPTSTKPFLSMIRVRSTILLDYLADHLRTFTDIETENRIKEEYVTIVIQWIITSSVWYRARKNDSMELYKYIFQLLDDRQASRIQRTILDAMNAAFIHPETRKENIFVRDETLTNLETVIRLWNTLSDDVVAVSLLTFGNYLLQLQKFRRPRSISDEMKTTLTILFQTSVQEIISIRAGFCLIFAEHSSVNLNTILSWFSSKWSLSPTKIYKILLQQTLFNIENESITSRRWNVRSHLQTNAAELMEIFVIDLHNYLSIDDCCDPEPNYVDIATCFGGEYFNDFRNTIKKTFSDEDELKRRLYVRFKNNPRDGAALISLYSIFGTITDEFVDMLEWLDDDGYCGTSRSLRKMTQVSDRYVIEKLLDVIFSKISNGKQIESCLEILRSLIEVDAITILEVHQRFSFIVDTFCNDEAKCRYCENDILKFLVDCSCFKTDLLLRSTKKLVSATDIDEQFESEFQTLDKNSPVLLCNLFS